ncbi:MULTISPECIES: Fis family transcriptional regulator [unclassified Gordonia (in: high G+C Gram-positive bacteria)]|uniref:Fis family transcriptional regulator n=1 Tax=unclassified Gordonia (in: high G+C Gram-positive bacteria) TaxID=2657482 RepID=UPI0020CA5CED|nr:MULTISPECIES: Fis family transcriptional regulator [unclassified Gordonia (in: high G+C Gram-positive bacteria)]MCX2756751.1 Fis family transcriptional regulator [Gordonia sp. 4N]
MLPGIINGQPACRKCAGIKLNVDCGDCGAEEELYAQGRCWRCVLGTTVDRLLTNPETGVINEELKPFAAALKSMKRANSGLTWIKQKHVTAFLSELARTPLVTHDAVDELPRSRTRDYVRELLITHQILPPRGGLLHRYIDWSDEALDRIESPEHRDVANRYIRWHHLRQMHSMESVTHGTFLRSKQTVTVTIEFLNWLTTRDTSILDLSQSHLDAWQAEGPSTREFAIRFLAWAIKTKLVAADLTMTPHRRGSPKMSVEDQQDAVDGITSNQLELNPRDRAAAILVLVFGQQIDRVVKLTWDHVIVSDDLVTVTLGDIAIALPVPLDEPFRYLAGERDLANTAAHPATNWVFRGYVPGQHINPAHLRNRLKAAFSTRAARLGTLHELTKLAPAAILADTLGYSPATIERHAVASAATYARYVSIVDAGG